MGNLQDLLKKVDAILNDNLTDRATNTQVSGLQTPPTSVAAGCEAPQVSGLQTPPTSVAASCDAPTDALLEALYTHFSYPSFRAGQREIIEAVLESQNVFAVFPTGHGKSLCYQLPALMLPGITVVISPLISLMKDQVDALRARGIEAVSLINSTQTWDEYRGELARLKQGAVKLLYISPERLRSRRFLDILNAFPISLFVIDEAHCISQWGRDFRPAYLALRDTIDVLHPRVIALFTATAPPDIREEVLSLLNIPTPRILTQGIERPNLKLSVQESEDEETKYQLLENFLIKTSPSNRAGDIGQKGIIYAGRRRETEEIAGYLQKRGFRADFYHAGLETHERNRVQEAFFDGSPNGLDIVVATNAFGMGIDKADIRYIVHWTLTGTLEEYCQEVGRAGRDGKTAACMLLYCHEDRGLHEWFIKENAPDGPSLLKLLKVIENFKGTDRYRTIAGNELEWMSGFKMTKIQVCLSYLEKLGFLKRWYNVPSQLSVTFRAFRMDTTAPEDTGQQELLNHLRAGKLTTILEFCEALGLNPKEMMEQLAELQSEGYIQYWGQEDLMLIELIHDSELFSTLTEEQIEVSDYVLRKRRQIDKVVFYALEATCRVRVMRDYFGEEVDENYRCGTCDLCQNRRDT